MSDGNISIRLGLEGADQVQGGAQRAAAGLERLGQAAGVAGQRTQLSGQQMAQVSAQLQDLFVQIQAGGSPLTALLQQGSQLSAVFGGFGAAVRGVASLISPTVLGVGALGGAVVATAAAYAVGSREADVYRRAIVLTGNAAGTTVGQLQAMAAAQAELVGTQAQAAAVLAVLAQSGRVAAGQLQAAADAAIRLERAGGPAVEKTAEKFAELGKEPVKALVRLNEAENFLTASLYKQVKALADQGRTAEAAAAAQAGYADVVLSRARALEQNLGTLERAWRSVTEGAKKAWDAMLNIGRRESTQTALQRVTDDIAKAEANLAKAEGSGERAREPARVKLAADLRERLAGLRETQAQLQELSRIEQRSAGEEQARGAAVKATISAEEDAAKRRKKALSDAADLAKQDAALRAEAGGLNADYAESLNQLQSALQRRVVTEAEYVQLVEKLIQRQPFAVEITRQRAQAERDAARAAKERDSYLEGFDREAAAVEKQVQLLRDQAEASELAAKSKLSLAQAEQLVAIQRLQGAQEAANDDVAVVARLQRQIDARQSLAVELAGKASRESAQKANEELEKLFDTDRVQTFGDALSAAFGRAGSALGRLSGALQGYARTQVALAERQAVIDKASDPALKLREQLRLQEQSQRATLGMYADMTGAAKGFFAEGTRGYKALEAAETAFRAYQLASDLAKGLSAASVAVATQAQGDPYTAWARMAAMAAAMASLGFAVGGSGGGGGGDGRRVNTGAGTVLGDAEATSQSIARASEQLAQTAELQLTTQSGMLQALRSIQSGIGSISSLVLRRNELRGSAAEQFGITEGTRVGSSGLAGFLVAGGLVGGLAFQLDKLLFGGRLGNALFGTKTRITGSGLFADAQSLGAVVQGGLRLQDFADVNTQRRFIGIRTSDRNSTVYADADPVLQQQFGQVLRSFYGAIELASGPLGLALGGVRDRLDAFVVDIGKIDLKGLTGEQISERLTAVLGSVGDQIALAAIPGLDRFQRVGEGYFETLVRVASGIETADDLLSRLGVQAVSYTAVLRAQGDVAAEIVRQSLVGLESLGDGLTGVGQLISDFDGSAQELASAYRALTDVRGLLQFIGVSTEALTASLLRGAGGIDALQSSLDAYLEGYFTEQERAAAAMASVGREFQRLGVSALPRTREQYRALVESIDTSTEAGQRFLGQVLGLAGAFDEAAKASEQAGAALRQNLAGFVNDFYGRDEVAALKAADVQQALRGAGVNADLGSRAEFRALVEGLDVRTEAGRRQAEQLLALASSFSGVADYLEETGQTLSQAAASAPAIGELGPLLASGTSQQVGAINQVRDGVYELINLVRDNAATSNLVRGPDRAVPVPRVPEVRLAA